MSDNAPAPSGRRRWLQFSVATMLVLMTALGITFGVISNRAHRQREAVQRVVALGGKVVMLHEMDKVPPPGPPFLRERLGTEYFDQVASINLRETRVKDEDLSLLAAVPSLKSLNLSFTEITSEGLAQIKALKSLRSLDLNDTRVTDLDSLSGLTNLERLTLPQKVKPPSLSVVSGLTNLQYLNLDTTHVSGADLVHLTGLTELRRLSLHFTYVGDDGIEHLLKLRNLEELNLKYTHVTDSGITQLSALKNLKRLNLEYTPVTWASVTQLEQGFPAGVVYPTARNLFAASGFELFRGAHPPYREVQWVRLTRGVASGDSPLARLTALPIPGFIYDMNQKQSVPIEALDCMDSTIRDDEVSLISKLINLQVVFLTNTSVSNAGLEQLRHPKVEVLELSRTKVTDAGLVHLTQLPNLNKLYLSETEISDAGLEILLTAAPKLRTLGLYKTRITDDALEHVAQMSKLESLELGGTSVTLGGLQRLTALKNLKRLGLYHLDISNNDLARLRELLPHCKLVPWDKDPLN